VSLDEHAILALLMKVREESPALYRHIAGLIIAICERFKIKA
jgi:hypothetical protein